MRQGFSAGAKTSGQCLPGSGPMEGRESVSQRNRCCCLQLGGRVWICHSLSSFTDGLSPSTAVPGSAHP